MSTTRKTGAKSINLNIIRKIIEYFLKRFFVNAIFITVFEILLFEGRSVLPPTQRGTGSERVKFSVKSPKNDGLLLKLFEK